MKSDLIIVGGGLNGPVLALAAAQTGLRSVVIDRLPVATRAADDFDGRAYALALGSQRLLAALDLWDPLKDKAQPMLDIKVSDGRAGEGAAPWVLHFDHFEIESGPMGYLVEDRHLRRCLLNAMNAHSEITHLAGQTVVAQDIGDTEATVTLASGQTVTGTLIAGCDGRASGTAERAGIARSGWSYEQTALVACVTHEKPHYGVAHQFFMPGGPLAILPLTENRSAIVWSEEANRAKRLEQLPDQEFLNALRPAFGSFLGQIALTGGRFSFPLGLSMAEKFVDHRLVLVGDAAHGVHPIAGQGLNAGLRDVAALSQVLTNARQRGEDIGTSLTLARYEVWRRPDAMKLAIATDAFNRLFSNDNSALRLLRDLGIGAVNAWPGLRRQFIREAAGLTGTLPDLMRE